MNLDPPLHAPLAVHGLGAVSPAGWCATDLVDAVARGEALPLSPPRGDGSRDEQAPAGPHARERHVPAPETRPRIFRHPRLRRSSPVSRYLVSAGLEALGESRAEAVREGDLRLGIIAGFSTGCVNYTRRFYQEVLEDPALASPILFPETVFNAPASHLAAILGVDGMITTLLGDGAWFATGLQLAASWLARGDCDGCVVIGGEETEWLIAEAMGLYTADASPSEGAGALYLELARPGDGAVRLEGVVGPLAYTRARGQGEAARAIRSLLESRFPDAEPICLYDGLRDLRRADVAEREAWQDWTRERVSIHPILGEAVGASLAWRAVAAVSRLQDQTAGPEAAWVSAVGDNEQAAGLCFRGSGTA